jgi:hypothetical protein
MAGDGYSFTGVRSVYREPIPENWGGKASSHRGFSSVVEARRTRRPQRSGSSFLCRRVEIEEEAADGVLGGGGYRRARLGEDWSRDRLGTACGSRRRTAELLLMMKMEQQSSLAASGSMVPFQAVAICGRHTADARIIGLVWCVPGYSSWHQGLL